VVSCDVEQREKRKKKREGLRREGTPQGKLFFSRGEKRLGRRKKREAPKKQVKGQKRVPLRFGNQNQKKREKKNPYGLKVEEGAWRGGGRKKTPQNPRLTVKKYKYQGGGESLRGKDINQQQRRGSRRRLF